jgi:hypothetical protein
LITEGRRWNVVGSGRRARSRLAAKVLLAAASAGMTACVYAIGLRLWQPDQPIRLGLVFAIGVVAFLSSAYMAVAEYRSRRSESAREKVSFVLRALAFDLQDAAGLDVRDLGVSAYELRRRRLPPWSPVLVRRHRERATASTTAGGVRWRPGKGVVGRCVAEGQEVCVDLAALDRRLSSVGQSGWSTLDPDDRLGLSWRDYRRVRGKYGVVLAAPIIDDSRSPAQVVGCVVVDAPAGTRDRMLREHVHERVSTAASAILRLAL